MKNTREVESLFTKKAATWSEKYSVNGPLRYRLDAFSKQLSEFIKPPAKVLDFGCGTGNLAGHLAACEFTVTACDISSKMIDQAREKNPSVPVDWFVLPVDWRELPFMSNTFDAIVASSTFEYFTDLTTTFVECQRILKSGGYLIATVPNPRKPIRQFEKLLRPLAMVINKMPLVTQVPKLGSYANYLKCSCNRMSLETWFEIGNKAGFLAVEPKKNQLEETALVFLRFQKPTNPNKNNT